MKIARSLIINLAMQETTLMKKKLFFPLVILILVAVAVFYVARKKSASNPQSQTISISGAFALYPMAIKWAEEFRKIHPEVRIDVSAGGAGKGMTDALSKVVDIGMVSREIYEAEIAKGAWWVPVAKDAVIPTINTNNPHVEAILKRGLSPDQAKAIWIAGTMKTWGDFLGTSASEPINSYTRSDSCGAAETWAKYFGKKQEDLRGTGVFGDPGIAEAVRQDKLGIGYNNVAFAYDAATKKVLPPLQILPIDLNANGQIDPEELFYENRDQLIAAIMAGKYPSPPARDLHFVTFGAPEKPILREFFRWVLTEGQKFTDGEGYIKIPEEKKKSALNQLK